MNDIPEAIATPPKPSFWKHTLPMFIRQRIGHLIFLILSALGYMYADLAGRIEQNRIALEQINETTTSNKATVEAVDAEQEHIIYSIRVLDADIDGVDKRTTVLEILNSEGLSKKRNEGENE